MNMTSWTSVRNKGRLKHRRRRLKKSIQSKIKVIILSVVVIFLLVIMGNNFILEATGGGTGNNITGSGSLHFWEGVLGVQLPGKEAAILQEQQLMDIFHGIIQYITTADLQDPKSLLALEVAGWSYVSVPAYLSSSLLENSERIVSSPQEEKSEQGETVSDDPGEETQEATPEEAAEAQEKKVLIYHSHITESFVPDAGDPFSDDLEITVARLGVLLAQKLEKEYGIKTIHNQDVFDQPRRYAYGKARPTIEEIVENNPDIGMVVDLHRDGISRNLTTVEVDDQKVGKTLIVIGSQHDKWRKNFNFGLKLEQALDKLEPAVSRGVRKQPFTYNQGLHSRSILVEIGGHENSLKEAKKTLPILAEALALTYGDLFEQ